MPPLRLSNSRTFGAGRPGKRRRGFGKPMRFVPLLALLACGDATPAGFAVDPTGCPARRESGIGKVFHESYLRAHAETTQSITVTLRAPRSSLPPCMGYGQACPARDSALSANQFLNQVEVDCVTTALSTLGVSRVEPLWYGPLQIGSDGRPVPFGFAFATGGNWRQIEALSHHPYVESIAPAPGVSARIGVTAPPIFAECPAANDSPEQKVQDARAIKGHGRKSVVVDLRADTLPPVQTCLSDALCDDLVNSAWARTIVARRMLTCVRQFIDTKLRGPAPDVNYRTGEGIPSGAPPLPPFGDIPHALTSFGLAMIWDEVVDVARHPYVGRIWTSPSLPEANDPTVCPPDDSSPVFAPSCPSSTESPTGKFSDAAVAAWSASSDPNDVLVSVRRDHDLCPQPTCADGTRSCPELLQYQARVTTEAQASQSCVRALIASIGGRASDEVFVLGNSFPATLTWSQIRTVAGHPHVAAIDPAIDGSPPP